MLIININNCNNIITGIININEDKLNILFGKNGTGKSTIARAIYLSSRENDLNELTPFSSTNGDVHTTPSIDVDGAQSLAVALFDDNYVNQYVYQQDSLIKDAFEVFVRSEEYDKAKMNIDDAMSKIKTTISNDPEIKTLQQQIDVLMSNIDVNKGTHNIAKRKSGIKGLLKGKGAYFKAPKELEVLKPFLEDDSVPKWAAWRMEGFNEFGTKGLCPYCSVVDSDKTKEINQAFNDNFDKASVEYVSAIEKALNALSEYLDMGKVEHFLSLFGVKDNSDEIEALLSKLYQDSEYLHTKLINIMMFNGIGVKREDIANLDTTLKKMMIDPTACDSFFTSDLMKVKIKIINLEIETLLGKVNLLKEEIGKENSVIQASIKNNEQDINDFLKIAGFKYSFCVEVDVEGHARALLKYCQSDGVLSDVSSPVQHLSWGEKHSFALILFMFDAIRNNPDLIILDDPISSFDSNKKYAIINRLFKTGTNGNSFYEKTVLMLTHDFEPLIDYVQTNSGGQTPTSVCAYYIENKEGHLDCKQIQKNYDILSSVVMFREIAMDETIDVAARIGCLRKYLEHQYREPQKESNAYNILSSLIHRRPEATSDNAGVNILTNEHLTEGVNFIKNPYIPDFDYNELLGKFSAKSLLERYQQERCGYIKMLILRAYTEADQNARIRLKAKNDVLRKYIDETYHIENDYIYSLDVRRFNIVPENYILDADEFVKDELMPGQR